MSIIKGQALLTDSTLVVYSDSGTYNPEDMIVCAKASTPNEPYCSLQCNYILNGIMYSEEGNSSVVRDKKITKLALQNRMTDAENMAILVYMDGAGPYKYAVKMLMNKLNMSTYIDLNRADTQAGLQLLVAAGLLTQDRCNLILSAPVQPIERYLV